jgi:hypothetical protein
MGARIEKAGPRDTYDSELYGGNASEEGFHGQVSAAGRHSVDGAASVFILQEFDLEPPRIGLREFEIEMRQDIHADQRDEIGTRVPPDIRQERILISGKDSPTSRRVGISPKEKGEPVSTNTFPSGIPYRIRPPRVDSLISFRLS